MLTDNINVRTFFAVVKSRSVFSAKSAVYHHRMAEENPEFKFCLRCGLVPDARCALHSGHLLKFRQYQQQEPHQQVWLHLSLGRGWTVLSEGDVELWLGDGERTLGRNWIGFQ